MRFFIYCIFALIVGVLQAQNPLQHSVCKPNKWQPNLLTKRMNTQSTYNYNIGYHRCSFVVFPRSSDQIAGSVMSRFTITKTTDTIFFDLRNELTVDSISHVGSVIQFGHANDRIWILNTAGWSLGQVDSVTIHYHGKPNGAGNGYFVRDKHQTDWIISTLSQPYGAYYWWPCKQTLNDKIDSLDVFITTHRDMLAGSQGVLVDSFVINPLVVRYHWKHRYPIATYLVSLAVSNYQQHNQYFKTENHADSMLFLNYIFPQSYAQAIPQLDTTQAIFKGFEKAFGPYPFWKEKYGHAQFMRGGGMEHQTMTSITTYNADLIAHELAHMWWGDAVTCGTWEDLWLNEGFATYSTCLCRELLLDSANFREIKWWLRYMSTTPATGRILAEDTVDVSKLFSHTLRYNRAGFFIHLIRRQMGDKAFFDGLKTYVANSKTAYGFSNTVFFKEYMEAACSCSLDTLFNDYYYNQGLPIVYINWKQQGFKLQVNYTQVQTVPGAKFFNMLMPLTVITDQGEKHYITEKPTKNNEFYEYTVPYQVKEIKFDEAVNILAIDTVKGENNNIADFDGVVWPNPADNFLHVYSVRNEEVEVIDMRGAKVAVALPIRYINNELQIDIRNLAPEMYVLILKNSNKRIKFVRI